MGIEIVRPEANRCPEMRNGFPFPPRNLGERNAQIILRIGIIRIQVQRCLEVRNSLCRAALVKKSHAAVVMVLRRIRCALDLLQVCLRVGVIRVEPQSGLVLRNCLLHLAGIGQRVGEVIVRNRRVGVELDRRSILGDRFHFSAWNARKSIRQVGSRPR